MILLVYANAGHGHKKAALAIQEEVKRQNPDQTCETMDILSLTSQSLSMLYPGSYQFLVTYMPFLWHFFYHFLDRKNMYPILFPFRNLMNRFVLSTFKHYLIKKNPKMIIFTHFLGIPQAINLRKRGRISSNIDVCITDFEAHSFWIYPEVDKYYAMCDETKEGIIDKWEITPDRVMTTGIPVSYKFKPAGTEEKLELKKKYNLDPNRLTLVFSNGSFGFGPTEEVLAYLAQFSDQIQVIIVCGKNKKMYERLSEKDFIFPLTLFKFVDFMPDLMKMADVLISKPGGITSSESLAVNVPMIISTTIPGQEEGNRAILEKYGVCWELKTCEQIKTIIKRILENPKILKMKKEHIQQLAKPNAAQDIAIHIFKNIKKSSEKSTNTTQ